MHELSLVAFTLLVQLSVGLTLMLYLFRKPVMANVGDRGLAPGLVGIAAFGGMGLAAAFSHLRYPLNAPYALSNLSSSWLSREILLASAFLVLLGLGILLALLRKSVHPNLLLAAALIGLLDIYCMAAIYRATPMATWNSAHTTTSFFGSVVNLGAVGMIMTLAALGRQHKKLIDTLFVTIMAVVVIRGVTQLVLLTGLESAATEVGMMFPYQPAAAAQANLPILLVGWAMAILGCVIFILLMRRGAGTEQSALSSLLLTGCAAIVLFEVLSRMAFFAITV